ncbi:glycoside hydrolase family 127 protein [Bacteroidota bacterium]
MKKNNIIIPVIFLIILVSCNKKHEGKIDKYPVTPVPFTSVSINDKFWSPRMDTNRLVTIPYDFQKCEETGRINNFSKAGGLMEGPFEGTYFNDSDVFKVIEGASYSLSIFYDTVLDKYLDDLIFKIAAAQEEDGYLYSIRTIDPNNVAPASGTTRWSKLDHGHELYNVGHMYEAAVAHYQATGKRSLLDVAIKNANLVASVFGPGKKIDVPGHEEIEIGLAKLYNITDDKKYLDLAKFFLDMRGRSDLRDIYGEYAQDHIPVTQQSKAVGHSVRAGYLYTGMADIAALTGNKDYISAINRIWKDVIEGKIYITGGIGARGGGEAFGESYELPNLTAYNETCAAIANALWNYRMFLLHADSKYIDVLERIIYNGFLSGISLTGNRFFYPNPLSSEGGYVRQAWFGCACCPTNIVRFLPSIPGYMYGSRDDKIFVNLFISGKAKVKSGTEEITITQETEYPWSGIVKMFVNMKNDKKFKLYVRIPGWARNEVMPGKLYSYLENNLNDPIIKINGKKTRIRYENGYAVLNNSWKNGDIIELVLPMEIRRVISSDSVKSNTGLVALERGPVVYCIEGIDNMTYTDNIVLEDNIKLESAYNKNLLNGINVISGKSRRFSISNEGDTISTLQDFTAIPYYAWAHRDSGKMSVWIARSPEYTKALPPD